MGLIKQNIGDQVYDLLKEKIISGREFRPGEKVDVSELQKWLQVSETPIRKATRIQPIGAAGHLVFGDSCSRHYSSEYIAKTSSAASSSKM